MTVVTAWQEGDRYEIAALGHATGSVTGCAYISGILYSLAGYLTNEVEIRVEESRMEPGNVRLRFQGGREARTAYEMAVIGLAQLEAKHPEIIRVEEMEKKKGRMSENT